MKRAVIAAAFVAASCGTTTTPPPPEHANAKPYRDLPNVPHRTIIETADHYVLPRPTKVSRSRPRPPARNSTPAGDGDIWAALARCESGMRQDAVGESVHFSYFQWKLATWRSVKAPEDPADPRDASYDSQAAAAQRLQARSGWGQWPACARKLGLL